MSTEQQEDVGASSYYAAYPLSHESERLMVEIGRVNNTAMAGERYKPVNATTTRRKSVSFDDGGDRVHGNEHDDDDHEEHRRGRSGPR